MLPRPSIFRMALKMRLLSLLPLLLLAAACGHRQPPHPPSQPLRSATLQQLVTTFNQDARAIHSMSLKLNLSARAGKHKYPKISAYLLIRKPGDIRLWGTFTLIGKLFDMASNGQVFQLSLPTRNQFIVGRNSVIPKKVSNPLQKLRPQVILNAMLTHPISATAEVALDPGAPPDTYQVLVLETQADHEQRLVRRITFSRYDLLPHRQQIYDGDGIHLTSATYNNYTVRDNLPIPTAITIERPVEGYTLNLQLLPAGITINKPLTAPHTFELTPPAGAAVITVGNRRR
ncbi:MAG: hypothetical protein ACRD1Y_01555 [Terriglobales bacterium]